MSRRRRGRLVPARLPLVAAVLAACLAARADAPARSARVDLGATTPGLTLADGTIVGPGGSIGRPNWLPAGEQAGLYTAEFGIVSFATPEIRLSFTPSADGQVAVDLRGPWTDRGDRRLFVDWEACTIDGASWQSNPTLRQTWHDEPSRGVATVKAGRPVVLTLRARPGGPAAASSTALRRVSDPSLAAALARPFRKGVNLSNWLEVPPGQSWGDNSVDADELRAIRSAGFDHVRIPVGWQNYTGTRPPYPIDEKWFAKVDRLVRDATDAGLAVLVNVHHFDALTDEAPEREIPRLVAIWRQLGQRWKDLPETVAFEILNEPREKADADVVNRLTGECLAAIRENNPTRAVFVGPAQFNSITRLEDLVLPDDPRLVVTVHSYAPFAFTHQGASWSEGLSNLSGVDYPGPGKTPPVTSGPIPSWIAGELETYRTAPAESNPIGPAAIVPLLDIAAGYSEATGRPVHLGEFGAYERADPASRLRYYADMTRLCRERGIGWAAWDWKAGFSVADRRTHELLPGMKEALFGDD